jgi:hypothetical protein
MGFSQLVIGGLALAERFEDSRVVRVVEKEVTKLVPIRIPAPAPAVAMEPYVQPEPRVIFVDGAPAPTPVTTPAVEDPRSGRLIDEARAARIAGDMGLALAKLEEAKTRSPDDPNVHFELGLVHEAMGIWPTASDYYHHVFGLGASRAGSLYKLAAKKLRDGFKPPDQSLGKLGLGRVIPFVDPNDEEGAGGFDDPSPQGPRSGNRFQQRLF